tara:strand:- start:17339 stop:18442 length:1104 start_codon:yes stop_codon:yes gene_type:complete
MENTKPIIGLYLDMQHILNKNVNKTLICIDNLYYYTFSYDKEMLCYNDEETKLYRMVIYSFPEQRLLGYFPPKSLEYSNFKQYYSNVTSNIVISEYINGDMINLMYDERCQRWHIFSQADNLKTNIIDRFKQAFHINENEYTPILDYLPTNYNFTFILKNDYMKNDSIDRFYLISVYEIENNLLKYIPHVEYENWSFLRSMEGIIHFPRKYDITNYDDLPYIDDIDGYILTDVNNGCTTKILNADITTRQVISKINPYYAYEYFCLRRIDKLWEYNRIYRKTKIFRDKIHYEYEKLISVLHQHYMNKYVLKKGDLIPIQYRYHVNLLHTKIYIPSLQKGNKEKITRRIVKDYLNRLNPSELLFFLYR